MDLLKHHLPLLTLSLDCFTLLCKLNESYLVCWTLFLLVLFCYKLSFVIECFKLKTTWYLFSVFFAHLGTPSCAFRFKRILDSFNTIFLWFFSKSKIILSINSVIHLLSLLYQISIFALKRYSMLFQLRSFF